MKRNAQVWYLQEFDHRACIKCGTLMQLNLSREEYPGYNRRTFRCQSCDDTMTEWAAPPTRHWFIGCTRPPSSNLPPAYMRWAARFL